MLLRAEVLEHRAERLCGNVNLPAPISHHVIGYARLGTLVLGLIFLATSTFARVAVLEGEFVPDRGVAPIFPSKPSAVELLPLTEGQRVTGADSRTYIGAGQKLTTGATRPTQIMSVQKGELIAGGRRLDSARGKEVNSSLIKFDIAENRMRFLPEPFSAYREFPV